MGLFGQKGQKRGTNDLLSRTFSLGIVSPAVRIGSKYNSLSFVLVDKTFYVCMCMCRDKQTIFNHILKKRVKQCEHTWRERSVWLGKGNVKVWMQGAENVRVKKKECLDGEGWEEKCNLGPHRGVTDQFVCRVMEKRWVGLGDKLARSRPGWTGRIRVLLRSVWKTFR